MVVDNEDGDNSGPALGNENVLYSDLRRKLDAVRDDEVGGDNLRQWLQSRAPCQSLLDAPARSNMAQQLPEVQHGPGSVSIKVDANHGTQQKRQRKRCNNNIRAVLLISCLIMVLYGIVASFFPTIFAPISILPGVGASTFANQEEHFIVFDEIGEVASSMAYLHVGLPINLTTLVDQSVVIANYLESFANTTISLDRPSIPRVLKDICRTLMLKLKRVTQKMHKIEMLLPQDHSHEQLYQDYQASTRVKRFAFLAPFLIELDKSKMYKRWYELEKKDADHLRAENDVLKAKLKKLEERVKELLTLPDLPPVEEFILASQDESADPPITQMVSGHSRQKRVAALPIVAAAALLSGVLGTMLGLYSASEIQVLKSSINSLKSQQNLLIQITNGHERMLQGLTKNLAAIENVVETLLVHNPTLFYAQLSEQIDLLDERILHTIAAIQQLQHRRLSVDFLGVEAMTLLHNHLKKVATAYGYDLLPVHLSDYFQLEASYIRHEEDIVVLLHVPCIMKQNLLKIYRFVPYPLPIQAEILDLNLTIGQNLFLDKVENNSKRLNRSLPIPTRTAQALFVQPEAEFIAIGRDNKYKILTDAEFRLCDKRSRTFLCEQHQVLRTDMEDSCLGALFLRSKQGIINNCKFKRQILRETVYQLSPTDHLVYTPIPFTAQILCQNGTHKPIFLAQNTRIHVSQGCSVDLKAHTIRSDFNIRTTPEPLRSVWTFDPMELPATTLEDAAKADRVLHAMRQQMEELQVMAADPVRRDQLLSLKLHDLTTYPWWIWLIVAILMCAAMGGIVAMILHPSCQRCKCFHRPAPSQYAPYAPPMIMRPMEATQSYCVHGNVHGTCCYKAP